jgi:hypothetical protein
MKRRKRKMKPAVRKYLAALKRARSLGHVDKKEHAAIKKYHGV